MKMGSGKEKPIFQSKLFVFSRIFQGFENEVFKTIKQFTLRDLMCYVKGEMQGKVFRIKC